VGSVRHYGGVEGVVEIESDITAEAPQVYGPIETNPKRVS